MLYELRQYRIKRGKMKEWVKLMESDIIPFQVSKGMVIAASFTAVEDATLYVWLRRFKSEAQRKKLYDRVYGSEHWKTVISPKIDKLLHRGDEAGADLGIRAAVAGPDFSEHDGAHASRRKAGPHAYRYDMSTGRPMSLRYV
jgi:hypothetical protein